MASSTTPSPITSLLSASASASASESLSNSSTVINSLRKRSSFSCWCHSLHMIHLASSFTILLASLQTNLSHLHLPMNHLLLFFAIPRFSVLSYAMNNIGDMSTHPSHPRVIGNGLNSTNNFIHNFLYHRVDLSFSQMIKSSLNKR